MHGSSTDAVSPAHRDRGGKQPGDRFTEAGAGQDYLARRGVPAGDVAAVSVGHDTKQSLIAVAEMADREGWRNVTLVSDPAHMARVDAIAKRLGFQTHLSPTRRGDGNDADRGIRHQGSYGPAGFQTVQQWDTRRCSTDMPADLGQDMIADSDDEYGPADHERTFRNPPTPVAATLPGTAPAFCTVRRCADWPPRPRSSWPVRTTSTNTSDPTLEVAQISRELGASLR